MSCHDSNSIKAKCIKAKKICTEKLFACEINSKKLTAETATIGSLQATSLKADEIFAGCEKLSGTIEAAANLDNLCFTFECDAEVNIQDLQVTKTLVEPVGTLIMPMEILPILNPPADTVCPIPGGNPLVTSTVDRGVSFPIDYLVFTNNSTPVGTAPPPNPSTGPWYFEKEPYSTSGKTVLSCGCREAYSFQTVTVESLPPIGSDTFSIIDMTFNTSMIDPKIETLRIDITFGYSTESTYDFFSILVDSEVKFSDAGRGLDAENPYLTGNISLEVSKFSTVRFQFLKDPVWYQGVDSVYFRIDKSTPILIPAFPTTLQILRGSEIIQDYSTLIDLNIFNDASLTLDCPLLIKTGDQLCLKVDNTVYASYSANLNLSNSVIITEHRREENFYAPVSMNSMSYNRRKVSDLNILQGWYETDEPAFSLAFLTQEGCAGESIRAIYFSLLKGGPYYLSPEPGVVTIFDLIGINKYKNQQTGKIYVFNPTTGELRLDTSDLNNFIDFLGISFGVYFPIQDVDERYWQYEFDLKNRDEEFNTPLNFFDFVGEFYKDGSVASLFGIRSYPIWPQFNPLQIDETQVKRVYGADTSAEYRNLLRQLRDYGVTRKYNVSRFIYWPYPGEEQPVLSENQKKALRWQVNQNRYPFLGVGFKLDKEVNNNYPKLCPGEIVTMKGTQTRLDNFPLRLAMDGYHTGPKPGPEFMQTYSGVDPRNGEPIPSDMSFDIYKEWSFYSIRLPITIDETNNKIYSSSGFNYTLSFSVTPGAPIGPFPASSALYNANVAVSPLVGKIVIAQPLNAATSLTNAEQIAGNIALIIRGGVTFTVKVQNAFDAGAIGVIIYNNVPGLQTGINAGTIQIPVVTISGVNGTVLFNTITAGNTVTVNSALTTITPYEQTLPTGTYYLSDIYDLLYQQYNNGESEFYIDVGNFLSVDYAINNLFVLVGTIQSLLYGPDDGLYQSSFFGPMGLDIGYLWKNNVPLVPVFQPGIDGGFYGTYAQLAVGQYKTHTPLSSEEAQMLINSINVATVEATHGPVNLDMTYEKYVACINDLSISHNTEVHTIIAPWLIKSDNGLYEFPTFPALLEKLKQITLDPEEIYSSNDYTIFGPIIYSRGLTLLSGHPGEFTNMYKAGNMFRFSEKQTGVETGLDWIIPQERFYYSEGTIVPDIGDVSNRSVEISIVNYLQNPQWLKVDERDGAPDYSFISYIQNSNEYATTRPGTAPPIKDSDAVLGDWLIGVFTEEKTRKILGISTGEYPVIGYITHYSGDFSFKGDPTLLPWYEPPVNETSDVSHVGAIGIAAAARILQYFNERNVKHIVIDIRNTQGGSDAFWTEFAALVGGKRYFSNVGLVPISSLEPNGIIPVYSPDNIEQALVDAGVVEYKCNKDVLDCNPEAYVGCDLLTIYPQGIWNGEVTGQNAKGLDSNIIWMTNGTAVSNPQVTYCTVKGTSLDGINFDGDFGKSTQFTAYGVYYLPFSTGGDDISYLNWWTKGRTGSEENPIGLMYGIQRNEAGRFGFLDGQVNGKGGILKGLDQEFSKLHQPQIKWNMNADIFFQDIGFTVDSPSVNPGLDGEPWMPMRYSDVDFANPLTYRDSVLERCVQMAADPNLKTHYNQNDGYGYVSQIL